MISIAVTADGHWEIRQPKCKTKLLFDAPSGRLSILPSANRREGEPPCSSTAHEVNGECLAVIGAMKTEETAALFVVTQWSEVAKHPLDEAQIYRIENVICLFDDESLPSIAVDKSKNGTQQLESADESSGRGFGKASQTMFKNLKSTVNRGIAAARSPNNSTADLKKLQLTTEQHGQRERLEDIARFISEDQAFYLCPTYNLTQTLQRMQQSSEQLDDHDDGSGIVIPSNSPQTSKHPLDSSFAWNSHMWSTLTTDVSSEAKSHWCLPLIRGHIVQRHFVFKVDKELALPIVLTLISRRSRRRAGMRYIKRGIDDDSSCANFVETEQLVTICGHRLSFVQVRGSVPVFWSQKGMRYRPAPTIDRSLAASLPIYEQHVKKMLNCYGNDLLMMNLIDQTGRERPLVDSFLEHVLEADHPNTAFVSFDYHARCSQLGDRAVSALIDAVHERITDEQQFTWIDKAGRSICHQNGVTRTNCVDCLDRTNVIQTAIAHANLQYMLYKVGVLAPNVEENLLNTKRGQDVALPKELTRTVAHAWADNGDAISVQYAGTAALKGDVTRHGQRQLRGLMKDGVNSASRYYKCHMGDAQRQVIIDELLGIARVTAEGEEETKGNEHEELRALVSAFQNEVMRNDEMLVGSYALINCEQGAEEGTDMNTVVLLTRFAYYVSYYDEMEEKFTQTTRIPLENVLRMQIGAMPPVGKLRGLLASAKSKANEPKVVALRVIYRNESDPSAPVGSYFHQWRPAQTRLFNNMALPLAVGEEANEYARAIADQFHVALHMDQMLVPREEGGEKSGQKREYVDRVPIEAVEKLDAKKVKEVPQVAPNSPREENRIYSYLRQKMEKDKGSTSNNTSICEPPDNDILLTTESTVNDDHKDNHRLMVPGGGHHMVHSISREAGLLFASPPAETTPSPDMHNSWRKWSSQPTVSEDRTDLSIGATREAGLSTVGNLMVPSVTMDLKPVSSVSSFTLAKGRQLLHGISSFSNRLKATTSPAKKTAGKLTDSSSHFDKYAERIAKCKSDVMLL